MQIPLFPTPGPLSPQQKVAQSCANWRLDHPTCHDWSDEEVMDVLLILVNQPRLKQFWQTDKDTAVDAIWHITCQ